MWDYDSDGTYDFITSNPIQGQNPQHTYSNPGQYLATLTTIDVNGCSNSSTQTVIVYENPNAYFIVPNTCSGNASVINNYTNPGDTNIISWNWS